MTIAAGVGGDRADLCLIFNGDSAAAGDTRIRPSVRKVRLSPRGRCLSAIWIVSRPDMVFEHY